MRYLLFDTLPLPTPPLLPSRNHAHEHYLHRTPISLIILATVEVGDSGGWAGAALSDACCSRDERRGAAGADPAPYARRFAGRLGSSAFRLPAAVPPLDAADPDAEAALAPSPAPDAAAVPEPTSGTEGAG